MITYSIDKNRALSGVTAVPNAFIIEFTRNAPAEYIAVYLYALMQYQNPVFINDDIAQSLDMSDDELIHAFEYWQEKGVLSIVRNDPLHIEFGRVNISGASRADGKYAELIRSLNNIIKPRVLSASELRSVYDWIEVFGLSEDAIKVLMIHCIDIKGPRTSIRYMDDVARTWADNKILTAEDAREYIESTTAYHKGARAVLHRFGLRRNPTEDEVALYKKWTTEYKLPQDVILDACAATVGASNPSFGYLSSVIDGYKERGVFDGDSLQEYRKKRDLLESFAKELFKTAMLSTKPNAEQRERIRIWLEEYHMPQDVLKMLAENAAQKAHPFSFMCKRVEEWNRADIRNMQDARADLERPSEAAPAVLRKEYTRHNYTAEDLEHIGVSFDDD